MSKKLDLGNWHDKIGTTHENSPNREAANKATRGSRRYKEMIDRDSKKTDFWKNMPFTFSKPAKRFNPRRDVFLLCGGCQNIAAVTKNTVAIVCPKCKDYFVANEFNRFENQEDLLNVLEKTEPDVD